MHIYQQTFTVGTISHQNDVTDRVYESDDSETVLQSEICFLYTFLQYIDLID